MMMLLRPIASLQIPMWISASVLFPTPLVSRFSGRLLRSCIVDVSQPLAAGANIFDLLIVLSSCRSSDTQSSMSDVQL
jgi:hypothetical protein